jgi:hypothetical protein
LGCPGRSSNFIISVYTDQAAALRAANVHNRMKTARDHVVDRAFTDAPDAPVGQGDQAGRDSYIALLYEQLNLA